MSKDSKRKSDDKAPAPGVLLYFEDYDAFKKRLTLDQVGRLLFACFEYGLHDTEPNFDCDNEFALALIWEHIVKLKLDRDFEKYGKKVDSSKYANYCKNQQAKGEEEIPYEEWKIQKHAKRSKTTMPEKPGKTFLEEIQDLPDIDFSDVE